MVDIVKLPRKLQDFRSIVRKGMILDKEQEKIFYSLPENIWQDILVTNFKDNLEYARRVILDKKEIIESLDDFLANNEKIKIDNLNFATQKIIQSLQNKEPIVFITDYDNDGSLSQSIINNYIDIEKAALTNTDNIHVEYARTVEGNNNRGFTLELVQDLVKEKNIDVSKPFLLITADNGINSLEEQKRIQANFPNASLIITDHHEPEKGMLIEENEKTIIFNPKYKASLYQTEEMKKERFNDTKKAEDYEFFDKYNISGATTIGVLLKNVLEQKYKGSDVEYNETYKNRIKEIAKLSKVSNVLDYVDTTPEDKLYSSEEITAFLRIQSLLNINNSMSNFIIANEKEKQEFLNNLKEEAKGIDIKNVEQIFQNVKIINKFAQVILTLTKDFIRDKNDSVLDVKKDELLKKKNSYGFNQNYLQMLTALQYFDPEANGYTSLNNLTEYFEEEKNWGTKDKEVWQSQKEIEKKLNNFEKNILKLATEDKMFDVIYSSNNKNYIEQLRPYIFSLMTSEDKTAYEENALNQMLKVFNALRKEEKSLKEEIRKANIVKEFNSDNVTILKVNEKLSSLLNRKIINKAYNNANNGFYLVLDNISENKISGSFRSLYDIDQIINNDGFKKILDKYEINIETPGHKRAAGFILTSRNGKKIENDTAILLEIMNNFNKQIKQIKSNDNAIQNHIESDIFNIGFINDFNEVVRGNIPHYKNVSPIVKIHEDMVYVDPKTNAQMSLEDYIKTHKYGYISLLIELPKHGEKERNLIIPVEMLRQVINSGKNKEGFYNDFVQLNYLDDGLFMANNTVKAEKANIYLSLKQDLEKYKAVEEAFKDEKLDKPVHLSREELKNMPFYKYNRYGKHDFEIFENMIISILDISGAEIYATYDVEANGFSNAKMFNLGTVNFTINESNAREVKKEVYEKQQYYSIKNNKYLLKEEDKIIPLSNEEYLDLLRKNDLSRIFFKKDLFEVKPYIYNGNLEEVEKINNVLLKDDKYIINREIEATSLSRLIKEKDFKLPVYMSYLTGVKNEHLNKYGKDIQEVDKFFTDFYKGKKVVFNAHNAAYDNRICRANTQKFFTDVLMNGKNVLSDTARFSKNKALAYDNMEMIRFRGVPEIPQNVIFYNNQNSKINVYKFLKEKTGQYPDRTGKYRLSFENDELYIYEYSRGMFNKQKISVPLEELLEIYIPKPDFDEEAKKKSKKEEEKVSPVINYISTRSFYADHSYSGKIEFKEDIPLNNVKYSAQELGNQQMIKNLLMDKVDFNVNIIPNIVEKYPSLAKVEKEIYELMKTYRFDKSFLENLNDNKIYYLIHDVRCITDLGLFEKDFMDLNMNLTKPFNDSWYYKAILSVKDPHYKDLNMETYEVVSNETGFSTELIKEVLTEAWEFKKKYNIENLIQDEIHVNGPINGDVMFETPLVLNLLAAKTMANNVKRMSSNLSTPIDIYFKEAKQFTIDSILNIEEREASEDSMGYTQLLSYDRNKQSDLTKTTKSAYKLIEENGDQVIRFGLGNDVLQPDTHIVAITNKPLTIENIREDAKKIAYLMKVKQIEVDPNVNKILSFNARKCNKVLKELAENYKYLELNSAVRELGKINDYFYDKEYNEKFKDNFTKLLTSIEDISIYQLERKLEEVKELKEDAENKYIQENLNRLKELGVSSIKIEQSDGQKYQFDLFTSEEMIEEFNIDASEVKQTVEVNQKHIDLIDCLERRIEILKNEDYKTALESAFESDENLLEEHKCLYGNVVRRTPSDYMLKNFDLLELTSEFVHSRYDEEYKLKLENEAEERMEKIKKLSEAKEKEKKVNLDISKEEKEAMEKTKTSTRKRKK